MTSGANGSASGSASSRPSASIRASARSARWMCSKRQACHGVTERGSRAMNRRSDRDSRSPGGRSRPLGLHPGGSDFRDLAFWLRRLGAGTVRAPRDGPTGPPRRDRSTPMHHKKLISILAAAFSVTAMSGAAIAVAQVEPAPREAPSIEIPTIPGQPVPVPVPLTPCQIAIQLNPAANVIVGAPGNVNDVLTAGRASTSSSASAALTSSAAARATTSSAATRVPTASTPARALTRSMARRRPRPRHRVEGRGHDQRRPRQRPAGGRRRQ